MDGKDLVRGEALSEKGSDERDQLEQPLQAPGERSRLEQRKGEYSGQSGVHWRP